MKTKVLILPSWYPSNNNPSLGIFFREQAVLMNNCFDIKVLYLQPIHIGKRAILGSIFSGILNPFNIKVLYHNGFEYQFNFPNIVFLPEFLRRGISTLFIYIYFKKMNFTPQILHSQGLFNNGIFALEIGKLTGIPVLVTEHLPLVFSALESKLAKKYQLLFNKSKAVSTVSKYTENQLELLNLNKTISVHGNLVDENIFTFSQLEAKTDFTIGWVGSLYHRKDPVLFIKIIKEIIDSGISIKADMLFANSEGEIEINALRNIITDNRLEGIITIHTNFNRNKTINFYHSLNLLVSTSQVESFGLAVAEAMACGLPVVSIDNGGVHDIIENNVNGIIVPLGCNNLLLKSILEIINGQIVLDPQIIRFSVIKNFGRVAFANKITSLYNSVLN